MGNLRQFNSSDFADLSVITYVSKRTVATVNIYIYIDREVQNWKWSWSSEIFWLTKSLIFLVCYKLGETFV